MEIILAEGTHNYLFEYSLASARTLGRWSGIHSRPSRQGPRSVAHAGRVVQVRRAPPRV